MEKPIADPELTYGGDKDQRTHFGFEEVSLSEKTERVLGVFHSVASKYDLMNDLMSGGLHRAWKSYFLRLLDPFPGMAVLDMAGGTGDIAFKILERCQHFSNPPQITVCDINTSMLEIGRNRSIDKGILKKLNFATADASALAFSSASFDRYTISFGIRNVTEIEKALEEAYRVLKPGGRFLCLEFSQVGIPLLRRLYKAYTFGIIPLIGKYVTGDEDSYRYLVESIEQFPDQEAFKTLLQTAGFKRVTYKNLSGGIVAVHTGYKE